MGPPQENKQIGVNKGCTPTFQKKSSIPVEGFALVTTPRSYIGAGNQYIIECSPFVLGSA
jgi:hypothetical protein